ncbi:MAG: nucleotidyltransferase domain-containing protein [Candidatus Lokiarchaeia archaeon]
MSYPNYSRIKHPKYRKWLEDYVSNLLEKLGEKVVAILVFGSVASGKARFDEAHQSDIDILAVIKDLHPDYFERTISKAKIQGMSGVGVESVWYTPEEMTKIAERKPPYILDALIHGIIIYDTEQFMEKTATKLKEELKRKGVKETETAWKWPTKKTIEEIEF